MYKQLAVLAIAATLFLAVTLTSIPMVDAQKKVKSCNNVKVQVKVTGVEENQTLIGSSHLDSATVGKTVQVEENETSATLAFNFKKLNPCPEIGSPIDGFINGTEYNGELKSTKKPNKITVPF